VEAPKLLKLLLFNYLFANGDAHIKNFSLLETPLGDYRLSPAYDLLGDIYSISYAGDEYFIASNFFDDFTSLQQALACSALP
jgi:HipA-like C-terminal domain